jgi:hypothetical protein
MKRRQKAGDKAAADAKAASAKADEDKARFLRECGPAMHRESPLLETHAADTAVAEAEARVREAIAGEAKAQRRARKTKPRLCGAVVEQLFLAP